MIDGEDGGFEAPGDGTGAASSWLWPSPWLLEYIAGACAALVAHSELDGSS
jgi:hypothetical protein